MCLNIHSAKTGCADAVQGMSTPQLCSCLQSLLKEIGTCITRTQLLQTLPRHSCLFLRFCWPLKLPICWTLKKSWVNSLKNSNVCSTWAVKKCGLTKFVIPVIQWINTRAGQRQESHEKQSNCYNKNCYSNMPNLVFWPLEILALASVSTCFQM